MWCWLSSGYLQLRLSNKMGSGTHMGCLHKKLSQNRTGSGNTYLMKEAMISESHLQHLTPSTTQRGCISTSSSRWWASWKLMRMQALSHSRPISDSGGTIQGCLGTRTSLEGSHIFCVQPVTAHKYGILTPLSEKTRETSTLAISKKLMFALTTLACIYGALLESSRSLHLWISPITLTIFRESTSQWVAGSTKTSVWNSASKSSPMAQTMEL